MNLYRLSNRTKLLLASAAAGTLVVAGAIPVAAHDGPEDEVVDLEIIRGENGHHTDEDDDLGLFEENDDGDGIELFGDDSDLELPNDDDHDNGHDDDDGVLDLDLFDDDEGSDDGIELFDDDDDDDDDDLIGGVL